MNLSKFLQMNWNRRLLRFLPFEASRACIRTLGRLYYIMNQRQQALIRATASQVFQGIMKPEKLQTKTDAIFTGIFDHYHEKLFVGYANFPHLVEFLKKQIHFESFDSLHTALAAGRGLILVTAHFGAVEFLPGALSLCAFPTSMICRFRSTRLRQAQGRRAGRIALDLIEPGRGRGFWAALQALESGRILIIECDEFESWRPDSERLVPFLNHRLHPDRTLDLLQRRSRAPLVTALVRRHKGRRYTCTLTPVIDAAGRLSEQCLEILEGAVRAFPEQWYQWQEFGKLVQTNQEVGYVYQESRYLAPEPAISLPDQA